MLLTLAAETEAHGPNLHESPPELIDNEEEWEVEIIDGGPVGHGFNYLIHYVGYSSSEDRWMPQSQLKNARESVAEFHARHPSAPKPQNYDRFMAGVVTSSA